MNKMYLVGYIYFVKLVYTVILYYTVIMKGLRLFLTNENWQET